MKYKIQSKWGQDSWKTIGSDRAGKQEYNNLEKAIERLKYNANLARVVCDMRIIDSKGRVHGRYDPTYDMRCAGSRARMIRHNAYLLWKSSGSPSGDGKKFWFQAENELKDFDGVFILPLHGEKAPTCVSKFACRRS